MARIASAALMLLAALPAFAETRPLPEPESLALLGIGFVAMLLAKRK